MALSESQREYCLAKNAALAGGEVRSKKEKLRSGEWPLWAKALKLLAKPEDKGVGDVVARLIGDEKSEAFKAWYKKTFGKSCGCTGRQARWNLQFPLN